MQKTLIFCMLLTFDLFSQNADSSFAKGKQQFEIGNYSKALNDFKEVIIIKKDYPSVNYVAGLSEFNLKKYSSAIHFFDQELQYNSSCINAYLYKAISYKKVQNYDAAMNVITVALNKNSDNVLLILEKANIYFEQKKYNKAITCYLKALSINENLQLAYYKLAFCEYYLKHNTRACEYWSKIEDPDDFENYEIIVKICKQTN